MMDAPAEPSRRGVGRAAFGFIIVTVVLDMLALGVIMPILPKLIESFVDNDTALAARILGLFGTGWALMQFIFSPVAGALSDRLGRRPVILISNVGLALDYVLMALAPSLPWLFAGRLISGITAASISTAHAYIADVLPADRRAPAFGMIGAAFGVGFILGPALGGLLGSYDPRLPFWVAAGLSFANASYGFLVLPESLPRERRSPFRWASANPVGAFRLLSSKPTLRGLAVVNFAGQLAHVVLPSSFVIYAGYRYGWDTATIGLTLAIVGVCSMIVQGGFIRPASRLFSEGTLLLAGIAFGLAGFVVIGLASNGYVSWLGIPLLALWGLANPSSQGLMTREVGPTQQGQLQGANGSVASVAQMIGPGLFTQVFAFSIGRGADVDLAGAPFLLAAVLLAVALVIAWRVVSGLPAPAHHA